MTSKNLIITIAILFFNFVELIQATTNVDCPAERTQMNGKNFSNKDFTGCSFKGFNLSKSIFQNAILNGVDFTGQTKETMGGADFTNSHMIDIKNCDINKESDCTLSPAQAAQFLKSEGMMIDGIDFGHNYPVYHTPPATPTSCIAQCCRQCKIDCWAAIGS